MFNKNILEEIAQGLKRGGIEAAYNFPGFNSHLLYDHLGGGVTSTNEKIAYELAWGSSHAGKKALVTFKNVGLNDAADPFINSILTGVGAGLVLVVFDDIELEGSQCILDSRHYFGFYGGLWFEPFDFASATILAEAAPELSNIFNIPVVIRLTNHAIRFKEKDSHSFIPAHKIISIASKLAGTRFIHDQTEPLVHPINGEAHRKLISEKNKVIQLFTNELHQLINDDGLRGDIYCGYNNKTANSHIITLPVPVDTISQVTGVYEVGDSLVAKELALQTARPTFTSHTSGYNSKNAEHYIITPRYERLMRLLKPHYEYITGDLGEYTKDTLQTLTHCLCFGSAISAEIGMKEAGKEALAITGDASFFHSAKNVLIEAKLRGIQVKIVLLDNGGSQGTGGQKIPGVMPDDIKVIEINFGTIDDKDLQKQVGNFVSDTASVILKVNHRI